MLRAQITIADSMQFRTEDDLKEYVLDKLAQEFYTFARNNMSIANATNTNSHTNTYTGTLVTSSNTTFGTVAGSNGTSSNYTVPRLRVVEYTKQGKVSRVELQFNEDNMWIKVPRIQVEE